MSKEQIIHEYVIPFSGTIITALYKEYYAYRKGKTTMAAYTITIAACVATLAVFIFLQIMLSCHQ